MNDLTRLLIQILIAILCAGVANILIPRQIPGKAVGLVIIGLAGVFLGEWAYNFFKSQVDISLPFMEWGIQDVLIIPSVIGCAIVLYVVTAILSWGRYGNR